MQKASITTHKTSLTATHEASITASKKAAITAAQKAAIANKRKLVDVNFQEMIDNFFGSVKTTVQTQKSDNLSADDDASIEVLQKGTRNKRAPEIPPTQVCCFMSF
jgi:hypothetical protein